MYSEQVQKELIERLRKRAECFDYDARPDIATDYEMAADVIEELKEKYDNSRESTKQLMEQLAKVVLCKDCKWWTKQEASLQGRCELGGFYPAGGWYCANGQRENDGNA